MKKKELHKKISFISVIKKGQKADIIKKILYGIAEEKEIKILLLFLCPSSLIKEIILFISVSFISSPFYNINNSQNPRNMGGFFQIVNTY